MRVGSGKFKARALKVPAKIRPTSQMVKKALFDILGDKITDSSFLELFAGSGNVGIEALSRGAKSVTFVEADRICAKVIAGNLKQLGLGLEVKILTRQADKALSILAGQGAKFDLIFLDPPYRQNRLKNSLINITQYDILSPQSWVIAEHYKTEVLPQELPGLNLEFTKKYGDAALSFYRKA